MTSLKVYQKKELDEATEISQLNPPTFAGERTLPSLKAQTWLGANG